MSKKCTGCDYNIEDCNDCKELGYIACCPDCKHVLEEESLND